MDLKGIMYNCLNGNMTRLQNKRKEILSHWREWSADQSKKIVVFGASAMCERCVRHLEYLGVHVDIICDNNADRYGEFMADHRGAIPIISVDEAMSGDKEILCFAAAGAQHFPAISAQLKQYAMITESVLKWHLDFYLETIIMLCVQQEPFMQKIEQLFRFYEDEVSLQILWVHLSMLFELENIPEALKSLSMEKLCVRPQYFLEDGRYLGKQEIMVDCGAYVGDTLEDLVYQTKYSNFKQYDCFELFPPTYEKLKHTVDNFPDEIRMKIQTYNMGVGEKNGTVRVISGSTTAENSTVLHNGDTDVKIIRLDDRYDGRKVSFIKMDIEGSEQDALHGAKNIISVCRPMCAICIYHSFAAFWEVPQLLKEYVPEYRLILRHHTTYWDDTVCYAKIGAWQ